MCGIVGWISTEKAFDWYDRRKFIDQALILDTVRGGDSTGIFVVELDPPKDKTPLLDWRKSLGGGHELVITPEYKAMLATATNWKYCVGHNRSATSGGVVIEAAHPFTEGPITLVHNGTVKKEYTSEKDLANDSHAICWKLSKDSPEKVIEELDGAFALVWHDARDDSLNFVRNKERPLHMAKAQGADTIYFASEAEMLYWLSKRLNLKLQDIVSLKPAHWVKFKPPALLIPEVKEVKLFSPKASAPIMNWGARDWCGTGPNNHGRTSVHLPALTEKNYSQTWMAGLIKGQKKQKAERKDIPEQLLENLSEYGLEPNQLEEFVPMLGESMVWPGKHSEAVSVMGWLMPQDKSFNPIPAMLHGITPGVWKSGYNQIWSVRPLGLKHIGWNLPLIVCRLSETRDLRGKITILAPDQLPPVLHPGLQYHPKATYIPGRKQKKDYDVDVEYPGPRHTMLSAVEWLKATAGGCMDCSNPLTLETDAWSVEWIPTDMGTMAMCVACQEKHTCVTSDGEIAEGGDYQCNVV